MKQNAMLDFIPPAQQQTAQTAQEAFLFRATEVNVEDPAKGIELGWQFS